ncbi:hypothetical protein K32_00860 [Kaistia sp. 32K]|nr:hypothetical protein K32_00860 [Kaistia sp. 32K]
MIPAGAVSFKPNSLSPRVRAPLEMGEAAKVASFGQYQGILTGAGAGLPADPVLRSAFRFPSRRGERGGAEALEAAALLGGVGRRGQVLDRLLRRRLAEQ